MSAKKRLLRTRLAIPSGNKKKPSSSIDTVVVIKHIIDTSIAVLNSRHKHVLPTKDSSVTLESKNIFRLEGMETQDREHYLHEDEILTNTDCELICSGKTRKDRSRILIDTITRRGPKAYSSFTRSLNLSKYEFLNAKISSGQCRADSDKAKKLISNALEIVPKTSNPQYFTTGLLSAKSRMFL
ncbi:hypothetical protein AM593_10424, partial [Mytilus galloprovincialis]